MIRAAGHLIFISCFFSPSSDDRCFSADGGSAIRIGPGITLQGCWGLFLWLAKQHSTARQKCARIKPGAGVKLIKGPDEFQTVRSDRSRK